MYIFLSTGYLKLLPRFLRPIVALMLPYVYCIKSPHRNTLRILVPEINHRREEALKRVETQSLVSNMIQILERVSLENEKTPKQIVDRQLGLAFAAPHGTTNHIVNVLYDLATQVVIKARKLVINLRKCWQKAIAL